jgi:drug/metabolite transporter (DMT)-like permease
VPARIAAKMRRRSGGSASGWLAGERLTWVGWVGTGIAFAGAGIIAASAGVSLHMGTGVLLVLGATVLWATYQVVQKTVCDGYSPLELTAWPTWIAAALLVPFFGASTVESALAAPVAAFVIALVLLGEVPDPLAFVGGAVVIAGVVLAQTKWRPARVVIPAVEAEAG